MYTAPSTMFGKLDRDENRALTDLTPRELTTLIPLTVLAFWIGIYPKPFFEILDEPVQRLVAQIEKRAEYPAEVVALRERANVRLAVVNDEADQQQYADPDHRTAGGPAPSEHALGAVMPIDASSDAP